MSKDICTNAIDGAVAWVAKAEEILANTITTKGESHPVSFPNTAYFLPIIYSFTGIKIRTLGELPVILKRAKELLPNRPAEKNWLPYLGNALDAGVAALFACEIIEACKYIIGPNPIDGIWLGAANDVIMRERGLEFVDGTAPGFAAIVGAAPTNEIAVKIARELQEKNLYVFMAGSSNGKQFAEQLAEEGVQLGWESRLVPFGKDVSAAIYALGFANRAALSFGGIQPGDFERNLRYNKNRIFAFVIALGEVTADKYAIAAGAINYGFPIISDTNIPQILPTGICTYEHVVSNVPHANIVEKALEVRGCKIKITKIPMPVAYGAAFEGERIRKPDMYVEFGGNITKAFEYVTTTDMDAISDGDIQVVGPDIDQVKVGTALPLAIWIEVAGRKMQQDFEPILERQLHHLINGAEGIQHIGQRDIVWIRVSKAAYAKGFRLRHFGEIIHAKFLSNYPAIVNKVKVTLFTEAAEVEKRIEIARKVYNERNDRVKLLTDESVEVFYSCLLCQSFAPNHVCIITPERTGLCGAYNWLDGKAAYEIDENGANRPVKKQDCLDPSKGLWEGINNYVYSNSHKAIESFCLYSIMDRPMTSCGCFEVICAYVPECNGIMAVNREFLGDTPAGMTFSTLAGNVGGGVQIPGFMGIGKTYLTSRKFISAEGGLKRLVWMPKELKTLLEANLKKRAIEEGCPTLLDQIADETIATDPKLIRAYMEKVKHPALSMPDMSAIQESPIIQTSKSPEKEGKEKGSGMNIHTSTSTTDKDMVLPSVNPTISAMELKSKILEDLVRTYQSSVPKEVLSSIADSVLKNIAFNSTVQPNNMNSSVTTQTSTQTTTQSAKSTTIVEQLTNVKSFRIRKETTETPIAVVKLGATKEEGGTRGRVYHVGGETCMPFHLWEGKMPHRPLVAMEVFDRVSEKTPPYMREIFGSLLENPVEMAKVCVTKYGADLISVRLEATHPEKGDRTAAQSAELVKAILAAVDVPLIITGHNHYEKINDVFKAVAVACEGENLLFNWVESDNYRTVAGLAIAYRHSLVAQSPIDVNISKQLNILLGNMNIKPENIIIDPMTGALGYGMEYTYSVMERIRLTALGGDKNLASPMIVSPGQECAKVKEVKALQEQFPNWGDVAKRAQLWELATALNFLYAGADILIMYHPDAVHALKQAITQLMEGKSL
jgi:acetyl-CoA synthase